MKVDVVVDIGNTRIKWGRCSANGVAAMATLPSDDPAAWEQQLHGWERSGPITWAVTSVSPPTRKRFTDWLTERGGRIVDVSRPDQLPLKVLLERPDHVGMDRLLDAVAACHRQPGRPAVIVDAGSAVTVDLVDETGAFRGGTILPGLRLMALALHEHTALLPLVEIQKPPPVLGTSTTDAMRSGIYYAVVGAINTAGVTSCANCSLAPTIFLTGGDAALLKECVDNRAIFWPEMTLEGVRLAAEAQP